MRLALHVVLAALAAAMGCASASTTSKTPAPRAEPEPAGGKVDLRVPRILPTMPEGEVLDLGPVLVPNDPAARRSPQAVLLEAVARLGADGFVYEGRSLADVYRIQRARIRTWRDSYTGDLFETRMHVLEGPVRRGANTPPPTADTRYYRAIRHLKLKPAPCPIDAGIVGKEVAAPIGGGVSFQEQIRIVNVLFAQQVLERRTFQDQRKRCLEYLDAQEAGGAAE